MLPIKNCDENKCPGWLGALVIGIIGYAIVSVMFIKDVMAQEVVVTFDRELPFESYHFTRTFDDKDEFEMWLANRLEDTGCDPYLKSMHIEFK